jgi:hypothetical protein
MNQNATTERPANPARDFAVNISPRFIARLLTVVIGFLLIMGLIVRIGWHVYGHEDMRGMVRFFDVEREANAPSWASAFLFGIISLTLFLIGLAGRSVRSRDWKHWVAMGCVAMYLSLDDGGKVHEMYVNWMSVEMWKSLPTIFSYHWVVVGIPFATIVGLSFLKLLLRLPRRTAIGMVLSGAVFVSGALGMEMISGQYRAIDLNWGMDMKYALMVLVEETFEFAGAAMFLCVLLAYIRDHIGHLRLSVGEAAQNSVAAALHGPSSAKPLAVAHKAVSSAPGLAA